MTYIQFNNENRTIYGYTGEDRDGVYRFDIELKDDWDRYTYLNIKTTVRPPAAPFYLKNIPLMVASLSTFLGLILFFVYLIHWIRISNDPKYRKAYKRGLLKNSKQRFKGYQDVRVEFIRTIMKEDEGPNMLPHFETTQSKTNTSVSIESNKEGYQTVP